MASTSNANAYRSNQGGGDGAGPSGPRVPRPIKLDLFEKRLIKLVRFWKEIEEAFWQGVVAPIAVACPPTDEDMQDLKLSSALPLWLFGYQFPQFMVMMFLPGVLHILWSPTQDRRFEALRQASVLRRTGVKVVLHSITRADSEAPSGGDGSMMQLNAIWDSLKSSFLGVPTVGFLPEEKRPEGALMKRWSQLFHGSGLNLVNVSSFFSELFSVKDESEIKNIKRASLLSLNTMKNHVVPQLKLGIDVGTSVLHSELTEETRKAILDPGRFKLKMKPQNVDICYYPVFQSGGAFDLRPDLRPDANCNDQPLYDGARGVIICALGARYAGYCANIVRTYLIDPHPSQKKAYNVLSKAQDEAISALRPGKKLSAVYKAAWAIVEENGPQFLPHLTENAGHGIGIEFNESKFIVSASNERVVKAGMVFNIMIGFQDLVIHNSKNPKIRKYSLLLADTVVAIETRPEILTGLCSKSFDIIARLKIK